MITTFFFFFKLDAQMNIMLNKAKMCLKNDFEQSFS